MTQPTYQQLHDLVGALTGSLERKDRILEAIHRHPGMPAAHARRLAFVGMALDGVLPPGSPLQAYMEKPAP